ncbi:MAG: aromatic ring-hydroxylating dioxygenase subunit alpha [Pseudomonadota bacterium]
MASLAENTGSAEIDNLMDSLREIAQSENSAWRTLPPEAYFSPELHALEVDRIFRRHWLCIGRVDQVANPGDYMALDVVGEPIVLVRDKKGEVRVLSNVCRHRWMKVCDGTGNRKAFVCPYHAWTYELDGRLRGAVEMKKHPGFDPKTVALPEVRHEVWQGFVYVNLDGKAEPLAPQLAPIDKEIAEFGVETWEVVETVDCDEYPWDWKVMQDNGECYHHIGAHPETFEANFPARTTVTQCDGPTIIQWCAARESKRTRHDDGLDYVPMYFEPVPGLTERQRHNFMLIYVLPNFFIYLQPDYGMKVRMFPTAAGRIRMYVDFLVPPSTKAMPDFDTRLADAVAFFHQFNEEDRVVNAAIQKGLQSAWAQPAPLSWLEEHNQHVARWVAQELTRP